MVGALLSLLQVRKENLPVHVFASFSVPLQGFITPLHSLSSGRLFLPPSQEDDC